jgi:hypothetical protein
MRSYIVGLGRLRAAIPGRHSLGCACAPHILNSAYPRPLQENGTRISCLHESQRKRAKPRARTPQVMNSRNSRSTKSGSPAPLPRRRASARKVSRCSRTTRCRTVRSGCRGTYARRTPAHPGACTAQYPRAVAASFGAGVAPSAAVSTPLPRERTPCRHRPVCCAAVRQQGKAKSSASGDAKCRGVGDAARLSRPRNGSAQVDAGRVGHPFCHYDSLSTPARNLT